jgi:hypothetical protein
LAFAGQTRSTISSKPRAFASAAKVLKSVVFISERMDPAPRRGK